MTSGAAGSRRTLAVAAASGAAMLTVLIAACGSGGVSGLASRGRRRAVGHIAGRVDVVILDRVLGRVVADGAIRGGNVGRRVVARWDAGGGLAARRPVLVGGGPVSGGAVGDGARAVNDVRTGQSWRLGDGPAQDEASVVKLDILETLLSASDGTGLSADNQGLAQQMIENSDNDAATSLWYAAGGTAGLAAYGDQADRTTPSPCVICADFPWPGWGLTTTVPYDQITLLKQLIKPGPLLTSGERQYALSLLENVTPGQAWGVSGGVPAGVTVALKNGWLPLNDDNTDWQINSEGWVSGDGRDYLISVLTTGNPSEQYGIDTISELRR